MGSQYASSIVYEKARELIKAGAIGELNDGRGVATTATPRIGAWQYSIPPDASPANSRLGPLPRHRAEAAVRRRSRLFRWRNYRDYGTGVAGDLFVHLLTGIHLVTGSLGPTRVIATGGLRYWNDGRDVPDVMLALFDYGKQQRIPSSRCRCG